MSGDGRGEPTDWEGAPTDWKGNFRIPPSPKNSSFDVHITYLCDTCNVFFTILAAVVFMS